MSPQCLRDSQFLAEVGVSIEACLLANNSVRVKEDMGRRTAR